MSTIQKSILLLCVFVMPSVPMPAATADSDAATPTLTVLERTTEPLLKCDRPWEDFSIGWCQVMKIKDKWHLWYSSNDHDYRNDNDTYFCYARSTDGVHWNKPSLGIHSYHGSKNNNILGFGVHGVTVFLDEHGVPAERFKAVGVRQHAGFDWWIYGATSHDGIHWKWRDEPILKKNADTANVCIRDGGVYRFYVRMWSGGTFAGKRIVGYTESATFGAFPDPVAILNPDKDDPVDFHLYNSATTKLGDHLYLMLPSGFFTKSGTVSVFAAFSRDGKQFQRLGRTALVGLGKGFDCSGLYVAPGAIAGDKPGTHWFYYSGVSTPHDANVPQRVRGDGGVGRFLLKIVD